MATLKFLHVLLIFIWIGNLLALTRLLGYHVKEDAHTQLQMAKVYKRMYNFVGLPTMILAVILGSILMIFTDFSDHSAWFVAKLLFVGILIVCDVACGFYIGELTAQADHSRGVKYKILHGICGLALIGVLVSVYIVK